VSSTRSGLFSMASSSGQAPDNALNQERKFRLGMTLATGYEQPSNLSFNGDLISEQLKININPTAYSKVLTLPPGRHVIRFACDAKVLGVLAEDALVAVRGRVEKKDPLPRSHRGSAHHRVARRGPHEGEDRRSPAEHLLDRPRDERPIALQALELLGVRREPEDAVREQIPRRLVAGDEESQAEREEIELLEALAVDLRLHERRQQILARPLASLGEEACEVLEELGRLRQILRRRIRAPSTDRENRLDEELGSIGNEVSEAKNDVAAGCRATWVERREHISRDEHLLVAAFPLPGSVATTLNALQG